MTFEAGEYVTIVAQSSLTVLLVVFMAVAVVAVTPPIVGANAADVATAPAVSLVLYVPKVYSSDPDFNLNLELLDSVEPTIELEDVAVPEVAAKFEIKPVITLKASDAILRGGGTRQARAENGTAPVGGVRLLLADDPVKQRTCSVISTTLPGAPEDIGPLSCPCAAPACECLSATC